MGRIRTSAPRTNKLASLNSSSASSPSARSKRFGRGFTLLEVLLVLGILALLVVAIVPKTGRLFRVSVQSSVRRFGAMVRFAYDQAILTGRLHRIVLNLDDQTWGVEAASPGELPVDKAKRELLGSPKWGKNQGFSDEEDKSDEPSFKKAGGNVLGAMPKGVQLVEVASWRLGNRTATKGTVSIYAYPSGFIDEATVTLAESGKGDVQKFNVKIQSLTGRVKVETENGPGRAAATE